MSRAIAMITAAAALTAGAWAGGANASTTTYQGAAGLTAFNADAGSPPVSIDFDSIPDGDIGGSTISGVKFSSPDGNTLDVLAGASTFTNAADFSGVIDASTNKLFPTSGLKVLSPGGAYLAPGPDPRQQDSLQLDFTSPLSAFGLDVLYQSYDCCTFTSYTVYDSSNNVLASGGLDGNGGGGGNPGAANFFGVTSSFGIARIVFTETDGDASFPDANIGFDTLRFGSAAVPEPAVWTELLLGAGLAGAALRMARMRRRIAA